MQRRFGTPDKPFTAFCPNCHVQITPGTQICSNCNSRICTHCYKIIPSLTANVCPNCGKRDFIAKSLKDIRLESAQKQQEAAAFITETEYTCPICHEKMALLPGGTLKCQSRSCGYIIDLKEYMASQRKEQAIPPPTIATVGLDFKAPRDKTSPKFFEVAKSEVTKKMNTAGSNVWEDLTTSVETKAEDQYFWKKEKLGKRTFASGTEGTTKKKWDSGGREFSIRFPWRKIGIAARFLGLIAAVALVGFGIFTGIRALISSGTFDNISVNMPQSPAAGLVITSVEYNEISDTAVTISWETNIPATSQVEYGISDALGYKTDISNESATTHLVTINGLQPDTTYYFKAVSAVKNGEGAIYSAKSSFATLAPPDTEPPVISGVRYSDVSDKNATITWKTDEKAAGKVDYGTSPGKYTLGTETSPGLESEHFFILSGLSPDTTYHFTVTSTDASGNEAISAEDSFTTSPYIIEGVIAGRRALDFTLPSLEGGSITLSQYRGKLVLVNFWFLGCGGCLKELPYIEEINRTWSGNKELVVLTVDIRDYETRINTFMEKNEYTFKVLLDTDDTKMWEKYGVTVAPMTFFIDTSGIIRKVHRGVFNNAGEIKQILDSL